jgi:hypothetical protein
MSIVGRITARKGPCTPGIDLVDRAGPYVEGAAAKLFIAPG